MTLDETFIRFDLESMAHRDRFSGLLRAFERTRPNETYVRIRQPFGSRFRLLHTALGQVIAGESPVDHALRVLDLAMTNQVDDAHADEGYPRLKVSQ